MENITCCRIQGILSFFLFPETFRIQEIWPHLLFPIYFRCLDISNSKTRTAVKRSTSWLCGGLWYLNIGTQLQWWCTQEAQLYKGCLYSQKWMNIRKKKNPNSLWGWDSASLGHQLQCCTQPAPSIYSYIRVVLRFTLWTQPKYPLFQQGQLT